MATVVRLVQDKTPEQLAEEYLAGAPLRYLACRGFGHAWPKPNDRRTRSKFVMTRDEQGWSFLQMTCRDCGMIRFVTAEPGVVIQLPARRYGYIRPQGYALPRGAGKAFSRNMAANETMRRYYEEQQYPTGGEEVPEKVGERAAGQG